MWAIQKDGICFLKARVEVKSSAIQNVSNVQTEKTESLK